MQQFSIGEAFKQGWALTKKNFGFLIGVFVFIALINIVFTGLLSLLEKNEGILFNALYVVIYLASIVVSSVLSLGAIKIALALADQKPAAFNDLFSTLNFFWKYLGASILYGLIVMGGLLLLIVPGLRWAVKYEFYVYALVEKNAGVIESLKISGAITKGSKWPLFFLGILVVLLNLLGILVVLVGLLVTVPLSMMVSVVAYRMLCQKAPSNEVAKAKLEGSGQPAPSVA